MEERLDTTVCYRHPDRPTRLSCSECGRPICAECSYDTPVGQRCPVCAKPEGRNRVISARSSIGRPTFQTAPVSFSIIAITVAIYVLGLVSSDLEVSLFRRLALVNPAVAAGQWWRLLTAALLHGGIMHILFNMYALYLFGPRLEREVGRVPFALLYLAAAAGGSAVSFLFGPEFGISIGASGAIFGLFGAWIYVAYRLRSSPAGRAMFNQLIGLLLINLALPLFVPGIDWRAHLGGLLTGLLIAFVWGRFAAGRQNAVQIRSVIAGAVLIAALVVPLLL